jgi:7,8-dihydropterin-6-yl-methyl-4-(beta-D-ribofuranosyl)aminobenzene 5'-phosphate synthase
MKLRAPFLIAAGLSILISISVPARAAAPESKHQITILYDAFGTDASMTKDWGFSAFVEIAGKRILFDTGNDADIFAANVRAKGIDLKTLDFVVLSHRHSDHMAGLNYVLSVNPNPKIHLISGGFHLVVASDDVIAKAVAALKDTFKVESIARATARASQPSQR